MIVPDDDEAAVHVGGGATGEADVPVGNEAAGEELTKVIVGGIELAGVTAGFENEANDTFEAAVADGELTEDIVGGVGTSGGHSGGRSCDEMTSTACWEPRSESGACLGSRPTPGEPLEGAKVVVEVTDPLAAVVVVMVVGVVHDAMTDEGLAEVNVGGVELAEDDVEGVELAEENVEGVELAEVDAEVLHLADVFAGLDDLANDAVAGEELAEDNIGGMELAGVISGLDDASKDLPAAAVAGVELAEVGRSMRLAIMIQAAAFLKAFLCMMYSSMRCVLNSGLSSVNS